MPARAGFATGRYVHEVGFWDNADAYDGSVPSWHHVLRDAGHEAVSIGKLHFRGRPGDDHGLSQELLPMHVIDGIGDVKGLVRENIPVRKGGDKMAKLAGPGESTYTRYDRQIGQAASDWLAAHANPPPDAKPWVLFVSMVAPHFPLTAPQAWYDHYAALDLPLPKLYRPEVRPHHPFTDEYARVVDYGSHFHTDDDVRRAIAGYSGLVSFMDEQMGQVLATLASTGLSGNTLVIYTSDHGDNLGARGLWGKSTMYEESAGVPMILAGPGIDAGRVVHTPVSHVDCAVTILEAAGARPLALASGHSLVDLAHGGTATRPVLSEYPRHRLHRRGHHVPLRALEILPLHRPAGAAVPPGERPRRTARPGRGPGRAGSPASLRGEPANPPRPAGGRPPRQTAPTRFAGLVRRPRGGAGAW